MNSNVKNVYLFVPPLHEVNPLGGTGRTYIIYI